jgi:hypothetical protein
MFEPAEQPSSSFHYVRPTSPNPYYLLLLDITRALESLNSCKRQLSITPFSTSPGEYILPVECDEVVDISRTIRETAFKLAAQMGVIGNVRGLPGATYYRLNMYLHSARGKSHRLDELLSRFRPICMQSTRQQRKTFASIQEAIGVCMQVCDQIQQETEAVLDTILMNSESFRDLPTETHQRGQQQFVRPS